MKLDAQLLQAPLLDHRGLDLNAAGRVTYLLEQAFRYDYETPVAWLRHRLVAVPKARHGGQYRRAHLLSVTGAQVSRRLCRDSRGNVVAWLQAEHVQRTIEFRVTAIIERVRDHGPPALPAQLLRSPGLLRPTELTAADSRLRAMASGLAGPGSGLAGSGDTPAELAERICALVHSAMTYADGVTSVRTTASGALAGGRGVCQDFAHVMLALCHLVGLPARYVSGHLLGQGGTHAWVEVLVPRGQEAVALPFDPCNGRAADSGYVTIATGRDYSDVAPTSGSYVGGPGATLTTDRRVGVLSAV